MNYFVSREELLEEVEKAVDVIFTAVAKMFSLEGVRFDKKLKELEANFLLLINTVGRNRSHQLKAGFDPVLKKEKKMEDEPRAVRPFDEVLDEVIDYILQSEDHDLIILVDELSESAKEEVEKKERLKGRLREIFKRGKDFISEQEGGKKGES